LYTGGESIRWGEDESKYFMVSAEYNMIKERERERERDLD
jgi:hypothetical protein